MSQRFFILVLIVLAIIRCWLALQVNLGVDEAHYFLYGKFLDWSYFDHPPLVGWVQALFQLLPLRNDLMVRLPAVVNSLFTSLLAYRFLKNHGFTLDTARWSVLALNTTLLFNLQSIMLLPDSLLMPLSFLIFEATQEAELKNTTFSWLKLGFYLGIAALSKYTAVFFVIAIGVYFLRVERWRKLLNGKFLFGVLFATLLLYPILHWNLNNNFISFKYQSDHIFSFEKLTFQSVWQTQLAQAALWGFGFYFIAFQYFFKFAARNKSSSLELSQLFSIILFVLFFMVSFSQFILPHWLLLVFTIMIPISVAEFLRSGQKKLVAISAIIAGLLSLLFFLELGWHFAPAELRPKIYKQLKGWPQMMNQANILLDSIKAQRKAIGVTHWTLGSRSLYYNATSSKIFVLDQKLNQFDIWNSESPLGYDLVLMIEKEKLNDTLGHLRCRDLQSLAELNIEVESTLINQIVYFKCTQYGGLQ